MNRRKWLIVLSVLFCLLLTLIGCQAETPANLTVPVGDLEWGMTPEDVTALLVHKGLPEEEIVRNNEGNQILLSADQCAALKVGPLFGFPVGEELVAVVLVFSPGDFGRLHLDAAYVDVTAESKDAVAEAVTKVHGKAMGDWMWEAGQTFLILSNGGVDTEVIVEYHAEKYVKTHFGKT